MYDKASFGVGIPSNSSLNVGGVQQRDGDFSSL